MENIQFRKNYAAAMGPVRPVQAPQRRAPAAARAEKSGEARSFEQALREDIRKTEGLTFSRHALRRMDERQISVTPQLMEKLDGAAEKARGKGVKEALMLGGGAAFIVNIPNRTVVTTMSGGELKQNVFTNIDGAVLL